ncbi:MAG: zf-HC2 domain-containing protein [candidate division WOR-3 bacterium]|nr:MAG: zf-HC2 domain-containing protein [candidate division WOR-3 bacterium]
MKRTSCQHTEKLLAYRLGLLTETEAREFEHHLEVCSVCQREFNIESAIEKELSVELQPGLIERRVRTRIQIQQTQMGGFFWLYAYRMAIYAVVAMLFGSVIIPFILTFPSIQLFDLSKFFSNLSQLMGRITVPAYGLAFIIALGSVLIIVSSLYSLVRMQR